MEEKQFQDCLEALKSGLKGKSRQFIEEKVKESLPVLSFKKYEEMLEVLRTDNILSLEQYGILRKDCLDFNKYLKLYGISSRIFGEVWAAQQLKSLDSRFRTPTKVFDSSYCGQYDLWLEGAKIGVKACRGLSLKGDGDRFAKALHYSSGELFEMHFRQLRIECCDVLVLIGVWIDQLAYWVFSQKEIKRSEHFAPDNGKTEESVVIINNQNILSLEGYRVDESKVTDIILKKTAF